MSKFHLIDGKLQQLANKLNAKLTKDRPDYPEALRTFEERRIDWVDNEILKAIIIQPNFESSGVNSAIWNFLNVAWHYPESGERLQWINKLVDQSPFEVIENNIDELLRRSEADLTRIRMENLAAPY